MPDGRPAPATRNLDLVNSSGARFIPPRRLQPDGQPPGQERQASPHEDQEAGYEEGVKRQGNAFHPQSDARPFETANEESRAEQGGPSQGQNSHSGNQRRHEHGQQSDGAAPSSSQCTNRTARRPPGQQAE